MKAKRSGRYVSRGGDKIESVAARLKLDFTGKTVLDVGSSTGGFTDFALQHGATKVYAVDTGNNQLEYKLRIDPRVVAMERTDIRNVDSLPELANMAVVDVSFIAVSKVLPSVAHLLSPDGVVVAMVKPQFEADKPTADKFKGVISDESVRQEILARVRTQIVEGFEIKDEADSGLAGAEGNIERFFLLQPKS